MKSQESGAPPEADRQRTGRAQQPNAVRVTTPYMTKYERARVLGTRALQIRYVQSLLNPHLGRTSRLMGTTQYERPCAGTGGERDGSTGDSIEGIESWEDPSHNTAVSTRWVEILLVLYPAVLLRNTCRQHVRGLEGQRASFAGIRGRTSQLSSVRVVFVPTTARIELIIACA